MCGICGCGEEHHHATRTIVLEQDVMAENKKYANDNRHNFERHHIVTYNLLSSPGSGKTTLLVNTIKSLKERFNIAVIEGDQQSFLDAKRIEVLDIPVKQINTGKMCHLDAHMVGHAVKDLALNDNTLLFIENVGNLVCPALFDLGEKSKVVILSVTEGEDKPLKYPYMFQHADLVIINKIDLLPYVDFNLEMCKKYIDEVNPKASVITLSAKTGEGMNPWLTWLSQP